MRIIFMRHADRDKRETRKQLQPITKLGKKEAETIGKVFKSGKVSVSCIYQGEFLRYTQTVKQINKMFKSPVIIDERLNEVSWKKRNESSAEYEKRIHAVINEIITKHSNNETVICLTSGFALHWFMTYFMKGMPIKGFINMWGGSISPVVFEYDKEEKEPYIFDKYK